jgi:hypothetical protein
MLGARDVAKEKLFETSTRFDLASVDTVNTTFRVTLSCSLLRHFPCADGCVCKVQQVQ